VALRGRLRDVQTLADLNGRGAFDDLLENVDFASDEP
jgi:hypothetical protein